MEAEAVVGILIIILMLVVTFVGAYLTWRAFVKTVKFIKNELWDE